MNSTTYPSAPVLIVDDERQIIPVFQVNPKRNCICGKNGYSDNIGFNQIT